MLAFYSAKYEDMPKNEGLDEWYLVDPKSSGAATGCKFEQEHRETGCNESHTQEQKAVVNWQNSDLSCPSFFTCRTELKLEPFFVVGVEDCRKVFP